MSVDAVVANWPHLSDVDERAVRWITIAYEQALAIAERVTASVDPLSDPASGDRDTEH